MPRIQKLEVTRFDVELREAFGIATGSQTVAENVLVTLTAEDGTRGYGEAAPFRAVSGETRDAVMAALAAAEHSLVGLELQSWRAASRVARLALAATPSALCAFETALLDAFARHAGISLFHFFGGADPALETDITLTTGSAEQATTQATAARDAGFSTLKLKVGGAPLVHDLERLRCAAAAAPEARFVLDANASLSAEEAIRMLRALGSLRERVVLFEQPTEADDLASLRAVREAGAVVAADESVRTLADLEQLVRSEAADVVNVKIMKSGVVGALDIAIGARAAGLGLMVGGMVETRLAMGMSACLAGGLGGFAFVDLDTPFFLETDPFAGGYDATGPRLALDVGAKGHGVVPRAAF